jgi:hypothetical protein
MPNVGNVTCKEALMQIRFTLPEQPKAASWVNADMQNYFDDMFALSVILE